MRKLTLEELRRMNEESDKDIIGCPIIIEDLATGVRFHALLDEKWETGLCAVYGACTVEYTERDYGITWVAYPLIPCKRGDAVWRICGPKGRKYVAERTVVSVTMYDPGVFQVFTNVDDWWGKTVFGTKEEAEQALSRRGNK